MVYEFRLNRFPKTTFYYQAESLSTTNMARAVKLCQVNIYKILTNTLLSANIVHLSLLLLGLQDVKKEGQCVDTK